MEYTLTTTNMADHCMKMKSNQPEYSIVTSAKYNRPFCVENGK